MKKVRGSVDLKRRREWRFELPLKAVVEGKSPQGKKFREVAQIENISATGAYFFLDSGVVVGARLDLLIDLPKALGDKKPLKLQIAGRIVRLEKPGKKKKMQGAAVRFDKTFKFIGGSKK